MNETGVIGPSSRLLSIEFQFEPVRVDVSVFSIYGVFTKLDFFGALINGWAAELVLIDVNCSIITTTVTVLALNDLSLIHI